MFQDAVSGHEINIYGNGDGQPYTLYSAVGVPGNFTWDHNINGSFSLTAIPEASTMLGFGGLIGAGGLGMLRSRRSRKAN